MWIFIVFLILTVIACLTIFLLWKKNIFKKRPTIGRVYSILCCHSCEDPEDYEENHFKNKAKLNDVTKLGYYCHYDGCNQPHQFRCECCQSHSCGVPECNKVAIHNGSYCDIHSCHTLGCTKPAMQNCNFCEDHKCKDCNNEVIPGQNFCSIHIV